jgi:hypothetical protein
MNEQHLDAFVRNLKGFKLNDNDIPLNLYFIMHL